MPGRGHQAPRKAAHCLQKEVGKNIKDKKETKEGETELHPYVFCFPYYILYFFLPPFEDNGLLFWVRDVLCWHSEVVLWNLLSVQMFF